MTLQEIEARKMELEEKINNASAEEIEELAKEVEEIKNEVPDVVEEQEVVEEIDERKLVKDDVEKIELKPIKIEEERKMANSKYNAETRAWAKKCLGRADFDEEEKRALGDAVTTTATTFVEATSEIHGVNNGGLFIPKEVRDAFMQTVADMSPFYRDIRKLQVKGNVDLPYLYAGDDANWYAELNDTVNEGVEYKSLQLTGWELAKDVVLTWKVEDMTVDAFVTFVIEELANKMGKALATAVIYGNGSSKPTGALNGLEAVTTGSTPIDVIFNTKATLSTDAKRGSKVYVANDVYDYIIGYKDNNGNYPYLIGVPRIAGQEIEKDDFLQSGDILVGNPLNYVLNEVTPVRIDWERTVKGRQTRYGAYGIYDGKPKPNSFAKGNYTPASI